MTFLRNQKWSTFVTFLFFLKSAPIWLFSRTELRHHYDFSHFLGPKLQRQFLGWKNALIPQLIDSDGRALHKDSESGPNSKITKITNMTFLQNTADLWKICKFLIFWEDFFLPWMSDCEVFFTLVFEFLLEFVRVFPFGLKSLVWKVSSAVTPDNNTSYHKSEIFLGRIWLPLFPHVVSGRFSKVEPSSRSFVNLLVAAARCRWTFAGRCSRVFWGRRSRGDIEVDS